MKSIRLNAGGVEAAVDQSCFEGVPKDTLVPTENNFVLLSSEELLKQSDFLQRFLSESNQSRINFFSKNLERVVYSLSEISNQTYTWFICFGPKKTTGKVAVDTQSAAETMIHSLTNDEKEFLRIAWKRDYVDSVLKSHGERIKTSQMDSFEERLNEGVHFIYRINDRIVGHGCWVEDFHDIVQEPCLYWHQWVDVSTDKEIRKSIHSQFFSKLLTQPLRAMSGVAVVNQRALRHCIQNGMKPVLLSITKFGGDKT